MCHKQKQIEHQVFFQKNHAVALRQINSNFVAKFLNGDGVLEGCFLGAAFFALLYLPGLWSFDLATQQTAQRKEK